MVACLKRLWIFLHKKVLILIQVNFKATDRNEIAIQLKCELGLNTVLFYFRCGE